LSLHDGDDDYGDEGDDFYQVDPKWPGEDGAD
jgi:hypothetical protein